VHGTTDLIAPAVITPTAADADPLAIASAVVEQLEQAWNDADGAAWGRQFAPESDFVNIRGEHLRGDGVMIGRAHQQIFDTIYRGSTVEVRVVMARRVAPGAIVAVFASTMRAPSGPLAGTNDARITAVLTLAGNRWMITAFHNTLVQTAR
jgi:uncharacterized protein (TIGR02246 family)